MAFTPTKARISRVSTTRSRPRVALMCSAAYMVPPATANLLPGEDVLDLLEEALVFGRGVLVPFERRAELAEQFLLLFAQVSGRTHFEVDLQVAAAVLAQERDAFAADADDASALGADGNLEA